jgi:hypothetical protein
MKPQKIGSHRGNVVRGAGEVEAGYSGIDRNWNGEPGGIGQGGAEKEEVIFFIFSQYPYGYVDARACERGLYMALSIFRTLRWPVKRSSLKMQ